MLPLLPKKWLKYEKPYNSPFDIVKGNVVRTNVYHKYIKDLKLNITIDLDGFIYYPSN